jgi:hypothetical protein
MPSVECPSCGQRAFARNSGKKSLLYREIYYHCHDLLDCGHQFVVGISVLRTVRASRWPEPLETLPMTTWRAAANDRAANDDGPPSEPNADIMTS